LFRNIRQASKYIKLLIGFKPHPELIEMETWQKVLIQTPRNPIFKLKEKKKRCQLKPSIIMYGIQ
jgi:hypothetical protein